MMFLSPLFSYLLLFSLEKLTAISSIFYAKTEMTCSASAGFQSLMPPELVELNKHNETSSYKEITFSARL